MLKNKIVIEKLRKISCTHSEILQKQQKNIPKINNKSTSKNNLKRTLKSAVKMTPLRVQASECLCDGRGEGAGGCLQNTLLTVCQCVCVQCCHCW